MNGAPTLPDKARKIVLGMVDMILFCDLEVTKDADGKPAHRRVIRTKPNVNYEAGDRTGRLPEVIELDFARFLQAFNAGTLAPTQPAAQSGTEATTPAPAAAAASTPAKPKMAASTSR
jgi:hypothetical protein